MGDRKLLRAGALLAEWTDVEDTDRWAGRWGGRHMAWSSFSLPLWLSDFIEDKQILKKVSFRPKHRITKSVFNLQDKRNFEKLKRKVGKPWAMY